MSNIIVFEDSFVFNLLCSVYCQIQKIHPDWIDWERIGRESANIFEKGMAASENKNLFSVQVSASKVNESPVLVWLRGLKIDEVLLYQIAKKINTDERLDGRIKIILAGK